MWLLCRLRQEGTALTVQEQEVVVALAVWGEARAQLCVECSVSGVAEGRSAAGTGVRVCDILSVQWRCRQACLGVPGHRAIQVHAGYSISRRPRRIMSRFAGGCLYRHDGEPVAQGGAHMFSLGMSTAALPRAVRRKMTWSSSSWAISVAILCNGAAA